MSLAEWIQIITFFALAIGFVYKTFIVPDNKAINKIEVIQTHCRDTHSALNETLAKLNQGLALIKENDLNHIEKRLDGVEITQTKILTILEERLPKNKMVL